jgi:mono/diheme cytochrome c family protein
MKDARTWLAALAVLLPAGILRAEGQPAQVRQLLEKHCAPCHGIPGKGKGGIDYILDRTRLVALGHVKPDQPEQSLVWQNVAAGQMPPAPRPPLSDAEKALLREWIKDGARDWVPAVAVTPLPSSEVYELLRKDLQGVEARQRRFQRYLSLAHLAPLPNAGAVLENHRLALNKLVNALSWSARIVLPTPVDAGRLLYRIDVRDYRWNPRVWDRLAGLSPYPLPEGNPDLATLRSLTGSDLPLVRGDWFIITAARPPFYYDFLQLPSTEKGLERLLQVESGTDIQEDRVARAGFTGSGVARHNRLLERHESAFGAYWRSYDFRDNVGRQNLFENPLGPAGTGRGFLHAGGEMVYHLPNGLHGYFVSDDAGRRIERAPVEIVSDPKRPDKLVEVGVSCFSCHAKGYIPKDDMIRAQVQRNPAAFTAEERAHLLAIYPPAAKLRGLLDDDNVRYRKATEALGLKPEADDPIEGVFQRYEGVVDGVTAAGELGVPFDVMASKIGEVETLRRTLGGLRVPRGLVPRVLWEEQYVALARELTGKAIQREEQQPGHTGAIRSLAAGPGGRFVTGGEDRVALVWNDKLVPVRRLTGHTAEVTAVVFRNDREVLTASADRSVRLWDITTGRMVRQFAGATDHLRALAVTPDGRTVFAAGDDRLVRGWDIASGQEVFVFSGHVGPVLALAVDPSGGTLASAGQDGTVHRWELARGTDLGTFDASARPIRTLAFSPDGEQILVGGEDRQAQLFSRTGQALWQRTPGRNSVVHVAFHGDRAVTACSQYRAEDVLVQVLSSRTGRETARLDGTDLGRVEVLVVVIQADKMDAILAQGDKLRRVTLPPER